MLTDETARMFQFEILLNNKKSSKIPTFMRMADLTENVHLLADHKKKCINYSIYK